MAGMWLLRPDRTYLLCYPKCDRTRRLGPTIEKNWRLPTENPNLSLRDGYRDRFLNTSSDPNAQYLSRLRRDQFDRARGDASWLWMITKIPSQ
jgi:hypothetical protein